MTNHIHKYYRTKLGKQIIYKCSLPGCTHYVLKPLIENRNSVCNRCGEVFTITKRTLKACPAKPHCENCFPKNNEDIRIEAALDILLEGEK